MSNKKHCSLTPKMKDFVKEYAKNGLTDAVSAGKAARYKHPENGYMSRLLRDPRVAKIIEQIEQEFCEELKKSFYEKHIMVMRAMREIVPIDDEIKWEKIKDFILLMQVHNKMARHGDTSSMTDEHRGVVIDAEIYAREQEIVKRISHERYQ